MDFPTPEDAIMAACGGRGIPSGPALDVGCGRGRSTLALYRVLGRLVVGVDMDVGALREASAGRSAGRAELVRAEASRLPFRDSSFSLALLFLTLHELGADAVKEALAEVRRVLRPGGILTLVDKCRVSGLRPSEMIPLLTEEAYHGAREIVTGERSVGVLSPRGVVELVESAGFSLEKLGVGRLGRWLDPDEFLSAWGRKTRGYLREAEGREGVGRIEALVRRIEDLARRHGYGPAPVVVARFAR